jgi:hypothetical protein
MVACISFIDEDKADGIGAFCCSPREMPMVNPTTWSRFI